MGWETAGLGRRPLVPYISPEASKGCLNLPTLPSNDGDALRSMLDSLSDGSKTQPRALETPPALPLTGNVHHSMVRKSLVGVG